MKYELLYRNLLNEFEDLLDDKRKVYEPSYILEFDLDTLHIELW